jgi:aryl-alcohol dehydrogenase-like predicted oxidoreductase
MLQIHRLDRNVLREEIMKALNDVVESGKVRYIGASSVRILIRFLAFIYLGRGLTYHPNYKTIEEKTKRRTPN